MDTISFTFLFVWGERDGSCGRLPDTVIDEYQIPRKENMTHELNVPIIMKNQ